MYNPYFQPNIAQNLQSMIDTRNRLDKDIANIQNQMQQPMQQPITQNIINTGNATIDFEAKYIKNNEDISNIPINRRTAFIDLNKGMLSIKEVDGDIKEYPIILPKTPEQIENEKLKEENELLNKRLEEMEMRLNANVKPIQPTSEVK